MLAQCSCCLLSAAACCAAAAAALPAAVLAAAGRARHCRRPPVALPPPVFTYPAAPSSLPAACPPSPLLLPHPPGEVSVYANCSVDDKPPVGSGVNNACRITLSGVRAAAAAAAAAGQLAFAFASAGSAGRLLGRRRCWLVVAPAHSRACLRAFLLCVHLAAPDPTPCAGLHRSHSLNLSHPLFSLTHTLCHSLPAPNHVTRAGLQEGQGRRRRLLGRRCRGRRGRRFPAPAAALLQRDGRALCGLCRRRRRVGV